jgi:RNase adaptor protein for sRNA GlmZ degradation
MTEIISYSSGIEALFISFGYLHGSPPHADIIVDVREHLRDPHVDPKFRTLTGHDTAVVQRVLSTPGASDLVDGLVNVVCALLATVRISGKLVRVAIGCAGGQHRSVVIAEAAAARVALAGWGAEVEHLHINKEVVRR